MPSATTPLGLLKHVTWMQRVWFEECIGGRPRLELGLVQTPEESFQLADDDTVTSVKAAHRQACATARAAVADLSLDAVVTGHGPGPAQCTGCTCRFCANWPITAVTPTSCANRYSPAEFRDRV